MISTRSSPGSAPDGRSGDLWRHPDFLKLWAASAISETWQRPSVPGIISQNAPKAISLRTLP